MSLCEPVEFPRHTQPLADRFWSFVPDKPADGCWLWYGAPSFTYGRASERRWMRASRAAWELSRGAPVPRDMLVRRSCGTENCVRPDHLYLVTYKGLQAEIDRPRVFGLRHPRAKLSDDEVLLIRRLRAAGWPTAKLADRFGVSRSYVSNLCRYRRRETVYEWTRKAA